MDSNDTKTQEPQLEATTEEKPKRKKRRPRTVEAPPETNEGAQAPQFALVKLPRAQNRKLSELAYQVETPSSEIVLPHSILKGYRPKGDGEYRALPQTEAKRDHLFIKAIRLEKNVYKGRWEISEVETNKGKFALGDEQNDKLSQQVMQKMTIYLRSLFEPDLEEYLNKEE